MFHHCTSLPALCLKLNTQSQRFHHLYKLYKRNHSFVDSKHVKFVQIQKTGTNIGIVLDACGESYQAPFKMCSILCVVELE